MFWVDQIVQKLLEKNQKDHYVVTDWKTPSGHVHMGALRSLIIHGAITRGLLEKGKTALWQYGFDDFDPMDSLPVYLPLDYKKYFGIPLSNIPSPAKGYESYAEYYSDEFQKAFNSLGEYPKIVRTSELYKKGVFNEAIKIVLDKAEIIREIYLQVANKQQPSDWLPTQMICQECGRVGTTRAYDWDGEEVRYKCEQEWVKYTQGCGFEGGRSPFNGNAKLSWRVEWPAKWFIFKTDLECAGKDHHTKGGSNDMGLAIIEQVFEAPRPYTFGHEFFLLGGQRMTSSKGIGIPAKDLAESVPPELLRMLMIMTRPNRAINFSPEGDTIPRLYDEYDRMSKAYRANHQDDAARQYYYSVVERVKPIDFHYRFIKVAYLTQMPHIDAYEMTEKEKGQPLTPEERQELGRRIEYAKKWLATYAPEEFKLTIQTSLPAQTNEFNNRQKDFLRRLANLLELRIKNQDPWKGEELHAKIHELKQSMGLEPQEAFQAIYLSILGKPSGPQAGWFLAALDPQFVIERFHNIQ